MTERRGIADILVARHRNGPTGTFCLSFEPQTTRFRDVGDATIAPLPPSLEEEEELEGERDECDERDDT